jgi:hypothetical protein
MSRTLPVSGKPYRLALVCRIWQVPRAAVYRHRVPQRGPASPRPGPVGPMADAALLEQIRAVMAASPFHWKAIARSGPGCGSPGSAPRTARAYRWTGDRQNLADRLDPVRLAVIVDERDHGLNRRSSSAWEKYVAAFRRISLASRNLSIDTQSRR